MANTINLPERFIAVYYCEDNVRVEVVLQKEGEDWYIEQQLTYHSKNSTMSNFTCPICDQYLNDDDTCPGGHDPKSRRYSKEDILFFVEEYDWVIQ